MAAYTLEDLAAIKQAIATGELSIERDGTRVQYRSMSDLLRAKRDIESDLAASGQLGSPRVSTTYAQFERD